MSDAAAVAAGDGPLPHALQERPVLDEDAA